MKHRLYFPHEQYISHIPLFFHFINSSLQEIKEVNFVISQPAKNMATVQLHIALLGPSCAPKASDKDIEKHLEEFDPSDTEDEVNVNRLLVWFGKLNKLLGVSVVAHWLLETHGHYFELGKPSLGKSAFRKGVPVKSVKWDREERIFQSFDVGTTNCTIGQINDIGKQSGIAIGTSLL